MLPIRQACPSCSCSMVFERRRHVVRHGVRSVTVTVEAWWCTRCDEAIFDGDAEHAIEAAQRMLGIVQASA